MAFKYASNSVCLSSNDLTNDGIDQVLNLPILTQLARLTIKLTSRTSSRNSNRLHWGQCNQNLRQQAQVVPAISKPIRNFGRPLLDYGILE